MKNNLLTILALGGLLFASSCQMDEPDAGTLTGEVDFTITAGIPGSINTYASNDGGSTNVDKENYDQRFILEVYDGENYTNLAYREVKTVEVGEKTSFDVRLLAKKYKFALWADFVTNKSTKDNLYNTYEGLNAVKIKSNRPAGQEIADAYCYSEEVDLTKGSLSKTFTLKRPFGKIRLISTDKPVNDVNSSEGYTPKSVTVTYGTDVMVPTGYNVLTGEASGENAEAGDYTFKPYLEDVSAGGTDRGELYILGIDYIIASKSATSVSFDVQVDNNGTRSVTNIPVSANKLTTVIGNFYTNEGSIDVIVEDEFGNGEDVRADWDGSFKEPETDPDDDDTYLITTPAELAWVAEQVNSKKDYFEGKTILLMNDIDLYGSNWTPVGNVTAYPTVTFKGTFDGQNHTISNLTASDEAAGYAAAGLFGSIHGTVKNVTLKDVNIRSTHYAGAVVGYSSMHGAIIENCHVDGGTITSVPEFIGDSYDNGDKAGGIIGYYVVGDKVSNCTAKNLTITAYRELGGITGCGPQSGMTGCSVENIILVQDNTNGYESEAVTTVGALGGRDVNNSNQPYDGEFASAVTKKVVGNISDAAQLASALTSDAAQIDITLVEDIDLSIASLGQQTGGSGEYKLGGENTESIVIDLNNHKLNLTTSYMSKLGAKNDDAVFTIQNGTMTSSTTDGTWDSYDLTFANCNYKIEDVVFEKSIAFTNDNRTVTMNGVTINEQNGDFYAMWISAVGQNITIDDLTLSSTGRGIKIDEEYVKDPAKVILNISNSKFTTASKAAIMVDSKEGAEINVTNVDISKVAADPVFTVWIDEDAKDYAGKVIVNGAKVRIEGSNEQIVATSNEELAAAAIADNATIYLTEGEYVIPAAAKGKTVTFIGTGNPEDVKVAVTKVGDGYENCDYGLDGSNATFEGITITTNSSTYIGYARCNGTYKNCIINGTYTLYGESIFENCEFNVSGDVYNIWTWGAKEIKFTGCTFNSDGKALLLYREAGGTVNLTVTGCTFNDKGGLVDAMKAAIEIGDSPFEDKPTYNVTVSSTSVHDYAINDTGTSTGTNLWGNKNSMPDDRLNVTIDGKVVY